VLFPINDPTIERRMAHLSELFERHLVCIGICFVALDGIFAEIVEESLRESNMTDDNID
jgi:hypothetical protein